MLITKENYEIYAIDYLDGELDTKLIAPMEQFLKQHPEIRVELEAMREFVLEPDESIVYKHKTALKKPVKTVAWWQWSLLGSILLVIFIGTTLFITKNAKSSKQKLTKIEKVEKTGKGENKPNIKNTQQKKSSTKSFAVTSKTSNKTNTGNKSTSTQQPPAALKTQQGASARYPTTPQVEPNLEKQPVRETKPTEVIPTFMSDSAQLTVPKDSTQLQITPRDIHSLPMAVNDSRNLHIEANKLSEDHKRIMKAMAQVEQQNNQMLTQERRKKIKTPFGNIKIGEIAEALIPESFVASKN